MARGRGRQGLSRRAAIQAGAISLLGLGMNHLAGLRSMAAEKGSPAAPGSRARSVIYVFLSGGLAQHESFDMKPDASEEIRGEFRPIATRTPGIQICEHLPLLAQRSHQWALVRSLTHPYNDHSIGHHVMLTGRSDLPVGFDPEKPKPTDWPCMASVASTALRSRNNLPPAIVLPEKLVHMTGRTIPGQFGGVMGRQHDPWFLEMSPHHPQHYGAFPEYLFHHEKGRVEDPRMVFQAPHLSLPEGLSLDRVRERVSLRDHLESQSRTYGDLAEDAAFDRYREAAISLLSNGRVHDAFDLSKADAKWLDRYGRNSFGWSLLMARQLVQVGISLVQVNLGNNETWDTHQAAFPNLKDHLLPPLDRALSALIDDLSAAGLLDETLIVVGSEFGRTPKISTLPGVKLPGRDHWGACQSILLAGGGVKGGNVIGASDRIGAYPTEAPQRPENLAATIYSALGLPRDMVWRDAAGRPQSAYDAEPIRGLM
ncbi:MAG: DUF1501 domain-containing protein [Verrucomicrobia bacterium]|nr:DUF1501 domain-containing protein [Verrucomicrobiota bacterium]MBI3867559.1 DUF1501 domain-containing protein [Verrucomicrobiota bacterium]